MSEDPIRNINIEQIYNFKQYVLIKPYSYTHIVFIMLTEFCILNKQKK